MNLALSLSVENHHTDIFHPPVFVLSCSSCVQLFGTLWIVAHQAALFMGFSRQEYWSGLPFPSPGDLPNPGIEPGSPALQADALPSEPLGKKETGVQSLVWEIHWRREWLPTPVFLPGKSDGQRNLVGFSPWGHKESDMTE